MSSILKQPGLGASSVASACALILFITQMPPNAKGHGGSQRAMRLLDALARLGPVDLLLIGNEHGPKLADEMSASARNTVRTHREIRLHDWSTAYQRWPALSRRQALLADTARGFCFEAPRTARGSLRRVAETLPSRAYDLVFAGRLAGAVLGEQLLKAGHLQAARKVVDFDDVASLAGERQLATDGPAQGRLWRMSKRLDCRRAFRAEQAVMRSWDAVSVCTHEDVALLQQRGPRARIVRVPNVVERPHLPPTPSDGPRLLFVGAFDHRPNVQGLLVFIAESWPRIRRAIPNARLRVVGMRPYPGLREQIEGAGAELHTDVADVEAYYRDCDIAVCPIYSGGGTRVKALEAMAYGRPLVSTTIGVEGLHVEPGRHALVADAPDAMAEACVRLSLDSALRQELAAAASELQRCDFGPVAFEEAVRAMVTTDRN